MNRAVRITLPQNASFVFLEASCDSCTDAIEAIHAYTHTRTAEHFSAADKVSDCIAVDWMRGEEQTGDESCPSTDAKMIATKNLRWATWVSTGTAKYQGGTLVACASE